MTADDQAAPARTTPTPAPPTTRLRSSDPTVMRALAHPLRIEILEILGQVEEATASEVAARTDQNVANCSFHLRLLASAGFIERAEPRGREKPWRAVHRDRNLRPDPHDRASMVQASELAGLYVQREAARVLSFLDAVSTSPQEPEWVMATSVNTASFWATAEEMAQLSKDLDRLVTPFADRSRDPTQRPEGARPGRLFATINPEPDPVAKPGM